MNDPRLNADRQLETFSAAADRAAGEAADPVPAESLPQPLLAARRRELELELTRIRSEASAARLQARAAELELMIRRLNGVAEEGSGTDPLEGHDAFSAPRSPAPAVEPPPAPPPDDSSRGPSETETGRRFGDWDQVRIALGRPATSAPKRSGDREPVGIEPSAPEPSALKVSPVEKHASDFAAAAPGGSPKTSNRFRETPDGSPDIGSQDQISARQKPSRRPARRRVSAAGRDEARARKNGPASGRAPSAAEAKRGRRKSAAAIASSGKRTSSELPHNTNADNKRAAAAARVRPASGEPPQRARRKRPTPWLLSAAIHAALFVFLGAMTLSARRPKDQVALSAATSQPEPAPMETFSIETPQPEPQPEQPAAAPVDAELSPVGELAATDLELDAPPAPPTVDTAELISTAAPAGPAAQLSSETKVQTEFCGVAGGGNHFVYLVDSSGSMGGAFASARAELLRSIDQLGPDQRFYVIFFDAEPDYMRLSDPSRDEPASVLATPQHKRKLRRWAMQVAINPGRAPYEPLRFALELRPDVIFLLSDGEFPESIEELLREENRVENLFGDSGPISIVHTIGYHSRQGESRMRSIARQNGGQYRHVPAP